MQTLSLAFKWVLSASVEASVLVGVVLVLQALLKKRIPAGWSWALWLVVVARLSVPWLPESPTSIFNALRLGDRETATGPSLTLAQPVTYVDGVDEMPAAPVAAVMEAARPERRLDVVKDVIPAVWLAGAMLFLLASVAQAIAMHLRVRRHARPADERSQRILAASMATMRLANRLPILETPCVTSPALFGFLRPRLLLPPGFAQGLSDGELTFVFLHELAHLRRRDVLVNWLVSVVQFVHWFNPVVWFAFYRVRTDRELACDELALSHAQPGDEAAYGRTILKVLESLSRPVRLAGLVGVLEDKSQLKRRIAMIAKFKPGSRAWSVAAVLVICTLAAVALTNAQNDPGDEAQETSEVETVTLRHTAIATAGQRSQVDVAEAERKLQTKLGTFKVSNAPLKDALEELSRQSGINIVLDASVSPPPAMVTPPGAPVIFAPPGAARVNLSLRDIKAESVLNIITADMGLNWAIVDDYVYVSTDEGIKKLASRGPHADEATWVEESTMTDVPAPPAPPPPRTVSRDEVIYRPGAEEETGIRMRLEELERRRHPPSEEDRLKSLIEEAKKRERGYIIAERRRLAAEIERRLDKRLPPVDFKDLPLEALVRFLSKASGVRMNTLVPGDTQDKLVTIKVEKGAVRTVLDSLKPAAGLAWLVSGDSVLILPADNPDALKSYDVFITSEDISVFDYDNLRAVTARIRSNGSNHLEPLIVPISYYLGDPDRGGQLIGETETQMPRRGMMSSYIPWDAPLGTYDIYVVLDPRHTLGESNPDNNKASAKITIDKAFEPKEPGPAGGPGDGGGPAASEPPSTGSGGAGSSGGSGGGGGPAASEAPSTGGAGQSDN